MTHVVSFAASHVAYSLIEATAWGFDPISGDHADVRSTRSMEAPARMVVPAKGHLLLVEVKQVEATTFDLENVKYLLG